MFDSLFFIVCTCVCKYIYGNLGFLEQWDAKRFKCFGYLPCSIFIFYMIFFELAFYFFMLHLGASKRWKNIETTQRSLNFKSEYLRFLFRDPSPVFEHLFVNTRGCHLGRKVENPLLPNPWGEVDIDCMWKITFCKKDWSIDHLEDNDVHLDILTNSLKARQFGNMFDDY